MSRVEWMKLVMRCGQPRNRIRQVLIFIAFEVYYQLCRLRGYRARHFLEPLPAEARAVPAGERLLFIWPRLPLSIRLLSSIVPFGRLAHAECVPYTREAAASARAAGRRVAVVKIARGEFKAVSR